MDYIYKLIARGEWGAACQRGWLEGSAVDLRDGFIHFSAADQVAETARRHFAQESDLLLVEVRSQDLGPALRWEPSRGGALFPHLYGHLSTAVAHAVAALERQSDGTLKIPALPLGQGRDGTAAQDVQAPA